MKIKEKLWQHRRDFEAIYVCEFCGYEQTQKSYDDCYFHANVIPNMVCPKCGKKSGKMTSKPIFDDSVEM